MRIPVASYRLSQQTQAVTILKNSPTITKAITVDFGVLNWGQRSPEPTPGTATKHSKTLIVRVVKVASGSSIDPGLKGRIPAEYRQSLFTYKVQYFSHYIAYLPTIVSVFWLPRRSSAYVLLNTRG